MEQYVENAVELHHYLTALHWDGRGLVGPDPGVRFNYRIWRFIKSYLGSLRWRDAYYYLQAQGYWVLDNWNLFARTGDERYRAIALRCSERILAQQRGDGAWDYPNPEWKGRVATVEGIWGSLGLLESFRHTAEPGFLDGALQWYTFLIETIGFQQIGDELAVNYFAKRGADERVPNNSSDMLRFLAELADVTKNGEYLQPCAGLLTFMRQAQKPTGEFPYTVAGSAGGPGRPHFQCYQYNAFECLGLLRYHELTGDPTPLPLITGVLRFLAGGLGEDGHALYQCGNTYRAVTYHAAALGAAFAKAGQRGIAGYHDLSRRAYAYVLRMRQPDGAYVYSRRDYRLLSDRRSYPRYLAMLLYHLLLASPAHKSRVAENEVVLHDAR